jgi:hypothetical protein
MSAALARLLGADQKELSKLITKFETMAGHTSEDVRLLSEIRLRTAEKIGALGLDATDTTSQELFYALQAKVDLDGAHLARAIGHAAADSPETCAQRLVDFISHVDRQPVLGLKAHITKNILRHSPPRKTLRQTHYRSLESMLKHEPAAVVFGAAMELESSLWRRDVAKALARLTAADFETRQVQFMAVNPEYGPAKQAAVRMAPLVGAVLVWPSERLARSRSLLLSASMLEAAEVLAVDSYYLRMNQFRPDFGKLAAGLCLTGKREAIGSSVIDWGNLKSLLEQPIKPSLLLAKLHPALSWWADSGHLIHQQDIPVSLHLADHMAGPAFVNHQLNHAKHELATELLARYGRLAPIKDYLRNQFDDTFIAMEPELVLEPAVVN